MKKNNHIIDIVLAIIIIKSIFWLIALSIPLIDEFDADGFACLNQPCVMPKITIYEWLTR